MPGPKVHIELPLRPFLYTLDQVAAFLSVTEDTLREQYVYFVGRSTGIQRGKMEARDISPDPTRPPEWRISERTLIAYLSSKGYAVYEARRIR